MTNTPGLGAAQQAYSDMTGISDETIALGYAVAYPLGVIGIILSMIFIRYVFRISFAKETEQLEEETDTESGGEAVPISLVVKNPVLPGVADAGVMKYNGKYYIGGVFTNGDFYVSDDLVHWGKPVHVVTMDNGWSKGSGAGNEQIHANDMFCLNGDFHL